MVVDQVDDLAMRRRQLGDASAQDLAGGGAIERGFRRIGAVGDLQHVVLVDVLVLALAQRGQRLEAGDREQPGRDLRAAFELGRGAPDVQEHLADQVLGHGGVAHHAQHEAVNPDVVTGIERVHRGAVVLGDTREQHFIRGRASSVDMLLGCRVNGDDVRHDRLPVRRWAAVR
ncbi:hypothetical protein NS44R_14600 [Mammaliicoccus sciuri]|nr:hypothetical protein NS44R_14600 [Mammaliicoccus sciuri]